MFPPAYLEYCDAADLEELRWDLIIRHIRRSWVELLVYPVASFQAVAVEKDLVGLGGIQVQ